MNEVMELLTAERNALEQTVSEILRANISLKAGCAVTEGKLQIAHAEIEVLKAELAKKNEEVPVTLD